MKIYEIIREEKQDLDEGIIDVGIRFAKWLGPALYKLLGTYTLLEPIYRTWSRIDTAQELHDKGDPAYTTENLEAIKRKEVAWLSAELAARFAGTKIISSIGWLRKFVGLFSSKLASLLGTVTGAAETALMTYLWSPAGAKFIADWLAGELFFDGKPVPGGQTWEAVVGRLGVKGAEMGKELIDKGKDALGFGDQQGPKPVGGEPTPSAEPAVTQPEAPKQKVLNRPDKPWMDPSAPVFAKGLQRNPVTGELEIKR